MYRCFEASIGFATMRRRQNGRVHQVQKVLGGTKRLIHVAIKAVTRYLVLYAS